MEFNFLYPFGPNGLELEIGATVEPSIFNEDFEFNGVSQTVYGVHVWVIMESQSGREWKARELDREVRQEIEGAALDYYLGLQSVKGELVEEAAGVAFV